MYKKDLQQLWDEYCSNPGIHGIRFVASPKRSYLERLLWLLVLVTAGWFVITQVWGNYEYYESYPMYIMDSAFQVPLEQFVFPAVTICSVFKIKYANAERHIARVLGDNATDEDRSIYWNSLIAVALLHFPHYSFPWSFMTIYNMTPDKVTFPIPNRDIPGILLEVGHKIDDIFEKCFWRGTEYNCSDMFAIQSTEEGFCYSFNSKTSNAKPHSDNPLFNKSSKDGKIIPLKNTAAGKHTGVEIQLKDPDNRFYHHFQKDSKGYNVIVHSPFDEPDISWNIQIEQQPARVQRIYINPSKYNSDSSVQAVPRKLRRCNWEPDFDDNMELDSTFCYITCRLNATKKECNCTPYYFASTRDEEYCELKHMECLANLDVTLRNHESDNREEYIRTYEDMLICNCIKPCAYSYYPTEKVLSTINLPNPSTLFAAVDVSFKYRYGKEYVRQVKFTFKEFAVAVGGYGSLLLGCSLISVLEIIYFLGKFLLLTATALFSGGRGQQEGSSGAVRPVLSHQKQPPILFNKTLSMDYPFLP